MHAFFLESTSNYLLSKTFDKKVHANERGHPKLGIVRVKDRFVAC